MYIKILGVGVYVYVSILSAEPLTKGGWEGKGSLGEGEVGEGKGIGGGGGMSMRRG